jgi:UDP-N-acetylglucosamine--N-acetylmuramyl-(pentapeptide) pyrophosphoryl-undecaprenol N-acetylglucosamine transferase
MSGVSGPVLIMAGGTGGHVFPALAVAEQLRARGVEVASMGTHAGLEARVVPPTGIPMHWISVKGLRGKGVARLLSAPFMLAAAAWQALRVIRKVRPVAVLGMGGFVTGPGGLMAWLLRKPLLIHEQNAVPGLTNRLLAPFASRVLAGFPGSLRGAEHTGNPVRAALTGVEKPSASGGRLPHLLVVGGSLGAAAFNATVPQALAAIESGRRPEVWHQTGLKHLDSAQAAYRDAGVDARIDAFIDDMAQAYGWADLVLCRSGALTIAELAAVGVASILVPYPYAVDDHQTVNARYLADNDAAVLMPQTEMSVANLAAQLDLLNRPEQLQRMAGKARGLGIPDAARRVADRCLAAAGMATGGVAA